MNWNRISRLVVLLTALVLANPAPVRSQSVYGSQSIQFQAPRVPESVTFA